MIARSERETSTLRPGDHTCWVYASDEEHLRVLIPYLREGIRRNERVLYFHHRQDPAAILGALRSEGEPVDELTARGALLLVPAEQGYLQGGAFEADSMVEGFAAAAATAEADGFTGLRAAGETEWLLPTYVDADAITAYEFTCARAFSGAPLTGLCGYDARYCPPDVIASIEAVHPRRIRQDDDAAPFWVLPAENGASVGGEVDFFSARAFERALSSAASKVPAGTFDASGLRFLDAAGLRSLIRAMTTSRAHGDRIVLRDVPPIVQRCMDLVGVGDLGLSSA